MLGGGEGSFVPGTITGNNVNIRVGPGLKSEIVGQLQKGQKVDVLLTDGEWCAIAPPPGISGWVAAEFVKEGVMIGVRVNIRSGPGIAYARLTQLRKGVSPVILEKEGDWLKIVLPPEARLWVNAHYVYITRREPPPPASSKEIQLGAPQAPPPPAKEEEVPPREGEIHLLPPPTEGRPAGTSFLPRRARAYLPSQLEQVKSYIGFIRKLAQPYIVGDRIVTHELVKAGFRSMGL